MTHGLACSMKFLTPWKIEKALNRHSYIGLSPRQ